MKGNLKKAVCMAIALAVQCVAVGWLIGRYESIVRNGTEVRFRCQAYDPYDPLRGRYLRTTVRETCTNLVDVTEATKVGSGRRRNRFFAKLEPSTNDLWRVASVAIEPPDDGGLWVKPMSSRVDGILDYSQIGLRESREAFEKRRTASPLVVHIELPDRLFLNERIAPAAEKVLSEETGAKGEGAVAVYRVKNGEIVITDIEIGGRSVLSQAYEVNSVSPR